jgi:hypothetical protein
MAHGDAWEGKWRGNWRMDSVTSTLHTTSEHGVSSITTAHAHTSVASSRLNWHLRRFKWTRPFRRNTKSGVGACAITFHLASSLFSLGVDRATVNNKALSPDLVPPDLVEKTFKIFNVYLHLKSTYKTWISHKRLLHRRQALNFPTAANKTGLLRTVLFWVFTQLVVVITITGCVTTQKSTRINPVRCVCKSEGSNY